MGGDGRMLLDPRRHSRRRYDVAEKSDVAAGFAGMTGDEKLHVAARPQNQSGRAPSYEGAGSDQHRPINFTEAQIEQKRVE
jgi:hypothetical protein